MPSPFQVIWGMPSHRIPSTTPLVKFSLMDEFLYITEPMILTSKIFEFSLINRDW
jgi:hypothetical protein